MTKLMREKNISVKIIASLIRWTPYATWNADVVAEMWETAIDGFLLHAITRGKQRIYLQKVSEMTYILFFLKKIMIFLKY